MSPEKSDPQIEKSSQDTKDDLFYVIVFDNNYNTFEEVIHIIRRATYCSFEVAEHIAWEIHNKGKSNVMIGPYFAAKMAAKVIRTIGIKVKVTKAEFSKQ